MLSAPDRVSVMGLPVHLYPDYPQWLLSRLQEGVGTHTVTLNPEMVMLARSSPELEAAITQAELVVPDGAGVIFHLRLRNHQQKRCPGIELASAVLEHLGRGNLAYPVCFYGGVPGRSQEAAARWQRRYPQLEILTQHGYLSCEEETQFLATLKERQPRLILVGLGVPRQELWIARHRDVCPQAVWMGVGGSFDIWAGAKSRAPQWFLDNNLEWLYRLYQEPWRWRRMLVLPQFAWASLLAYPGDRFGRPPKSP